MTKSEYLKRLSHEYDDRKQRLVGNGLYSLFYPPYLFSVQQRKQALRNALKRIGITSLKKKNILEIGCGSGGVLLEYLTLGVLPNGLFGIDLLYDRLLEAHNILPKAGVSCANGQYLPFTHKYFDIVLQYTALSSVLDRTIKKQMAYDMLRVLKPQGLIIWYDFWLNPTNPQTKGIQPKEIRELFPNCRLEFHKVTLAPPIARAIVPLSWIFALLLEELKIFNTHYLVLIRKSNK